MLKIVTMPLSSQTTDKTLPKFYNFFKVHRQDSSSSTTPLHNGSLVTHSHEETQTLNMQFQSIFTQEDADQPNIPPSPHPTIPPLVLNAQGIEKLLYEVNMTKVTGPDNIPCRVLKTNAGVLAFVLQVIFLQAIQTGSLLCDWFLANVTPIFKSGDRTLPSNYRLVSITSVPCRTLEYIIHRHTMDHFDRQKILTENQHSFRPKHSYKMQLLETTHDIFQLVNPKIRQVDIIVLDFAKAFVKVPHKQLDYEGRSY
ncbi:uncharacterized protein LOC143040508 [Oratosquilla oratoria]|uniref:uncharacterized protein LOC143040508 n=1 Tax=Oratosquilla oratoria TaxID=337810 RepID=UPI003F775840